MNDARVHAQAEHPRSAVAGPYGCVFAEDPSPHVSTGSTEAARGWT